MERNPLDNIYAKLARADQHIGQLQIEIDSLIGAAPYSTIVDMEPDAVEDFRRMLSEIDVPPRIAIVAGEAIHQTRSALDHLASELVLINGRTISKATQFPIYQCRPANRDDATSYAARTEGMTISAKAIIDGLQPFNSTDPDNHPLALLQRLNNRDKHQALLVTVAAPRPIVLHDVEGSTLEDSPDDHANWHTTLLDMNVQRAFGAYVVFPEYGTAVNQPVVYSVYRLLAYVSHIVVPAFRPELTRLAI